MIVAVKTGGSGDPANNSRLATVIAKAKAANMPNDNIKRTIDKALGSGNADSYENVVYEGYGPPAWPSSWRRSPTTATAPPLRCAICWTSTARAWAPPAVCPGPLTARVSSSSRKRDLDEDTVMMDALDAGADDMQVEEETFEVYTDPDAFGSVLAALEEKGYTFVQAAVRWCLRTMSSWKMRTTSRTWRSSLICWDNDDVQNVWHGIRSNFRHSKRRSGFVQTSCLFITLPRKIRPAI